MIFQAEVMAGAAVQIHDDFFFVKFEARDLYRVAGIDGDACVGEQLVKLMIVEGFPYVDLESLARLGSGVTAFANSPET